MAQMTNEYSKFPNQLYSLHNFKNLYEAPDSVLSVVYEIKSLQANGNYAEAAALINENKDILRPYFIDGEVINAMDEEIRNLEIYAREAKQFLYYDDEMPDGVAGDIWIG